MIDATTSSAVAHQRIWDAIIVGAGPAGAVTALGLAQTGLRALLVDHSNFPREKVCGGCLNADAVSGIRKLGLGPQLDALGGVLLNKFCVSAGRQRVSLQLQGGVAVSRGKLDAMLVEAAIAAGADFLPNVRVRVGGGDEQTGVRQIICSDTDASETIGSRTVVVATGLSANLRVDDPELAMSQSPQSRIGAGTTATSYPDHYSPGTIFMAVARSGYVGLTRTEGNLLNIAAALDVAAVREISPSADGPLRVVCERILTDAGFPVSPEMLSGDWRGTIGLTRRRRKPASYRLFVVGDAAGYVEPFTGEGMAWAIRGGRAVVPFVEQAVNGWAPSLVGEWSQSLRILVTRRQRLCRAFARMLRHPMLVRGAIRIVATIPAIGRAVIRRLNKGSRNEFFDSGFGYGRAA